MKSITYSALRQNLAQTLDAVTQDHAPILITRQSGEPAVVLSLEDFRSYEETAYLMASVNNATRLNQAISSLEQGEGQAHALIEE